MKITENWIEKWKPCGEAIDWFRDQDERDDVAVAKKLLEEKRLDWLNWMLVRRMSKQLAVRYAIYAAEQVIQFYEKKYSEDKRPRKAIRAAKRYLKQPTKANRSAAESAALSAWSAWSTALSAWSAWSARSAAESAALSAAWSAWSAWSTARSAAWSAWSARSAAESAAESAARSDWSAWSAAYDETLIKICKYGMRLLKERTNG